MGVCVALMALLGQVDEGPVRDKTGMRWELPFPKALERAKNGSRLLMIKPIAFGTSKDGGW